MSVGQSYTTGSNTLRIVASKGIMTCYFPCRHPPMHPLLQQAHPAVVSGIITLCYSVTYPSSPANHSHHTLSPLSLPKTSSPLCLCFYCSLYHSIYQAFCLVDKVNWHECTLVPAYGRRHWVFLSGWLVCPHWPYKVPAHWQRAPETIAQYGWPPPPLSLFCIPPSWGWGPLPCEWGPFLLWVLSHCSHCVDGLLQYESSANVGDSHAIEHTHCCKVYCNCLLNSAFIVWLHVLYT